MSEKMDKMRQNMSASSLIFKSANSLLENFIYNVNTLDSWTLLYCIKISRHENFAVSGSTSKNREIKMLRKMHFELNCEIKMPQNTEFLPQQQNFSFRLLKTHKYESIF